MRPLVPLSALLLLVAASACGDGGEPSGALTAPAGPQPSATSAVTPAASAPTASGPNESGSAPIFWRTADNFQTVVVGEPYLVLFRITNGYDETSLTVSGSCTDCEAGDITSVGTNSPPIGQDAPGSYYPMNLTFPEAGSWELTVRAGADDVVIPLEVAAN
jgi:hypothetical protein